MERSYHSDPGQTAIGKFSDPFLEVLRQKFAPFLKAGAARINFDDGSTASDVQMPGSQDGCALAREYAERWPHIKIRVASAQAKPGPDDLPKGAVFIGKPFSAEVVHTRLIGLLPDGQKRSR
jgi:hypothetical protein